MKPSNDNTQITETSAETDAEAQPPFMDGHENESVMEHVGDTHFDAKDGFGNAQWDAKANKKAVQTVPAEKKIPPAF